MKIRKIKDLLGTDRDVNGIGFKSVRVLLEKDGMGFSLHKTYIPKGDEHFWHYKNHQEACYCVSGKGMIKNMKTEETFLIEKDTTYILDQNDPHTFQSFEDVVLISVFNPPIKGREVHRSDGSYGSSFEDVNGVKSLNKKQ